MHNPLTALLLCSTFLLLDTLVPAPVVSSQSRQAAHVSQATSEIGEEQCRIALTDAANMLEGGRNVRVATMRIQPLSEEYRNFPTERPYGIYIGMEGQATANILNSPQLMTSISNQLIAECRSVSLVKFAMHQTDWNIVFGLVGESVESFECIDPSPGMISQWGKTICI